MKELTLAMLWVFLCEVGFFGSIWMIWTSDHIIKTIGGFILLVIFSIAIYYEGKKALILFVKYKINKTMKDFKWN